VPAAFANPALFLYFLVFPLVGTVALGLAVRRAGPQNPRLVVMFVFALTAFSVALTEMRGVSFAAVFAFFGWLALLDRLFRTDHPVGPMAPLRIVLGLIAVLAALPFAWTMAGAALKPDNGASAAAASQCGDRADMASLAAAPPGLVLAPIRLGPRILVATRDSVLGAPYHRDNDGNRAALDMLTAPADQAHRMIAGRGVRYVAYCTGDPDLARLTTYRADSLLNDLASGRAPSWLSPLGADGPIRAWKVAE
jgi:hypothetical protein